MLQTTQFYLRMWIDLDQDGMFADSSELLVDPVGPIDVNGWTQTITISDTVALGQTRMRIALKAITGQDTLRPSGCGNFLFGEVEDYCISIDDVCPEVVPVLLNVTETTAVIKWDDIDASIIFIYRYREVGAMQFSDPELTQDTIIEIMDLKKCKEYQLQTLSVCVQDTSSWQDFFFKTQCPNAVVDVLPVASEAQIYPNPFSDQFILAMRPDISGMAEVRLFNMMGAQLEGRIIDLQQGIAQQIEFTSLDNLAHGMYLVILQSGDRQQVFKMVK